MMDIKTFKENMDLYAADLSRWPVDLIAPAQALIDSDPAAQQYWAAMQRLDDILHSYVPDTPDLARLESKILAQLAEEERAAEKIPALAANVPGFARFHPAYLFAPGGGLLAAAIIGFYVGLHPGVQADLVLDPVSFAEEQILGDDLDIFEGEIF